MKKTSIILVAAIAFASAPPLSAAPKPVSKPLVDGPLRATEIKSLLVNKRLCGIRVWSEFYANKSTKSSSYDPARGPLTYEIVDGELVWSTGTRVSIKRTAGVVFAGNIPARTVSLGTAC